MELDLQKVNKVLAFFGSDVEGFLPSALGEAPAGGYTLLALDVSAMGIAAKAGLPYTLADDWIDPETMIRAQENAAGAERGWFQNARNEFTREKICWPEFDHHAMHSFWIDAMLAMAFAQAFRARDIKEIHFFRRNPSRRPAVYYIPSDTYKSLWEEELPGIAKPYELPQKETPPLPLRKKSVWSRILNYTKRNIERKSYSGLKGKIVLAFYNAEFHRFESAIRRLCERLPGRIAGAAFSYSQLLADKIAAKWSFPVVRGPSPSRANFALAKQFMRGYTQAKEASSGEPWQKPLECLAFHFEYYCKERWPLLAANLHFWLRLWRKTRPKAVLVSSLQDSESQLPAEAAKRLNIPNFSIPHGAVTMESPYPLPADGVLYGLLTEKILYERSGIQRGRLIACRGVVPENEYNFKPTQTTPSRATWRVLVLTDPIGFSGLTPLISPVRQLEAIRALREPPEDIKEKLHLNIKSHPEWPDSELFDIAGGLKKHLLPCDCELEPLLEKTDLVVAVNYYGSALIHALRRSKAVVFFWTDPLIGERGEYKDGNLFLPAGTLVRTAENLWNTVRNFFSNEETAEKMRSKAHEFFKKNLDDTSYPDIGEVASKILSKKENR